MTFAMRTNGDPLSYATRVREIVRRADVRVPVTNHQDTVRRDRSDD